MSAVIRNNKQYILKEKIGEIYFTFQGNYFVFPPPELCEPIYQDKWFESSYITGVVVYL